MSCDDMSMISSKGARCSISRSLPNFNPFTARISPFIQQLSLPLSLFLSVCLSVSLSLKHTHSLSLALALALALSRSLSLYMIFFFKSFKVFK